LRPRIAWRVLFRVFPGILRVPSWRKPPGWNDVFRLIHNVEGRRPSADAGNPGARVEGVAVMI